MSDPQTFDNAIELLDRYCEKYGACSTYNQHLVAESKERLQQLKFILTRVRDLERAHDGAIHAS